LRVVQPSPGFKTGQIRSSMLTKRATVAQQHIQSELLPIKL